MAKKPKTIFVLTTGDYSSYRIVGLCSSRYRARKALKFLENQNEHDVRVETFYLDIIGQDYPKDCQFWNVRLTYNGEFMDGGVERNLGFFSNNLFKPSVQRDKHLLTYTFRLWAKDLEHATKTASDYFFGLKAENMLPENNLITFLK